MSINLSEVKKHKKANSAWIVIHNDVYDVTKFLNEHPGGADSLLDVAGRDGTRAFEDVGHSEDARKLMQKYKIGSLPAEESIIHVDTCWWWLYVLLALGVAAGGAFAYKKYGSAA